ncbi:DUF58 domain-containing protein [Paenibacillus sp. BR2-3]|uniref:DUF58 domain-containing protein n=1 Tax=Paenibacillus sp. BR2-3 TaxID=3048494 RepID=UPI00397749AE
MEKGRVVPLSSSNLIDQQQKNDPKPERSLLTWLSRSAMLEWGRMLAAGGLIFGLYIRLGGSELLFLCVAAGVVVFGGLLLYLFGPGRVIINRSVTPAHTVAGESVTVLVEASFRSRIPLPWMTITDRWSGGSHQELLFPGFRRKFTYTYKLRELSRGFHHLEDCSVRWGDLPGWFTGSYHPKDTSGFKVLPAPLNFGRMALEGGYITEESAVSPRGGVMDEGTDIRDYRPGDPLSRIHWKSTARRGSLQSRTPEREKDRTICIVLDNASKSYEIPYGALGPRRNRRSQSPVFEKAVSAAMGLMVTAERSGTYVQLYSGGWPEGVARHEGLGKIPARVLNILTEIMPDGTRNLPQLLEDASRGWIPGMSIAVITGVLEPEGAKVIARLLAHGVKVNLYYAWDRNAPDSSLSTGRTGGLGTVAGTIGISLMRLGAGLHCFDHALPVSGKGEEEAHESPGKWTVL